MPDYAAIAELFARYGAANDLHDRELLASTLTADATATIHIVGVETRSARSTAATRSSPSSATSSTARPTSAATSITNIRRLGGDRVNAYLTLIVTDAGETVVKSAGIYEVTVAEEDGALKLSSLVLSLDRAF